MVLPLVSFTLINCPTKALPNWVASSVFCLILRGILSPNLKLLVPKPSLKTGVNQFIVADSNVLLGAFLQSIGSSGSETSAPSAPSCVGSPSARPKHSQSRSLIDPVLAFTKAYRLRGNSAGLKQPVFFF